MASTTSRPSASERDSYAAIIRGAGIKSSGDTEKATWLIESHAVNHMTGNRSLLVEMAPVDNQVVGAGNGKGMQVWGVGSVITEAVVLHDVWFVPELGMNLVSVHQVTTDDPDLTIKMAGSLCHVTKMSDGSDVGRAHLRPDNKYEVDFLRIQQN